MKKLVFIFGFLLSLVPVTAQPQDSSLIGYWNFNECSGDTAHDLSLYGNHGAITGAEWVNLGGGNCGLYFDTTYEYVRVPNSPTISDLSQITVEAMVTVDSLPAEPYCHVIVEKEYAYAFYILSADSCLWAGVWDPSAPGTWIVLTSASKIPIGLPVYVAFTANKVTKEMKIYINCQLDTTKTDNLLPNWVDGHHDLFFGVDYGYGSEWFAQFYGKIDWIRLWRKEVPVCPPTIPTLTEWGLIIFGVVLLGFITWVFLRRRKAVVSY
jgi:hypothetical protein